MYNKEIIQNSLSTIDSNTFQKLCADIITYKHRADLLSIEATGSQIGKNSTIKGVPDIYFYTKDQKFVFIEATTQKTSLKKKFIDDINGCLKKCNEKQISILDISSIYLMFTHRITANIETKIREEFKNYKFEIKFIGIDQITDELKNAPFLLQDYLDISLNIGYIVPLNYFTHNYDKKKNRFATPIDNPFYNREKELQEIKDKIVNNNILILKGDAGVGKTKLAIEAIDCFCKNNSNYKSYAIGGHQSIDITNDLYNRILKEKNVILLIDDANQKKSSLSHILNSIYKNTTANIKLILTVRQYAFQEIINSLNEIEITPSIYTIDKFTREELSNIISNTPFLIKDRNTQERIFDISKGNPRLAVMGARAINQNKDSELFIDILSLYDQYFNKTIAELGKTTKERMLITVLGLVSTFNTIKLEFENDTTRKICEVFDLNFKELKQAIEELEEKELLEIHIKFKRAKICEQITYTYFFYKLFIDKPILSFDILLSNFYQTHSYHINYLINAITDTFGEQELIKSSLKSYYQKIQPNNEKKEEIKHTLFSSHWNFLFDELFLEFYEEISNQPLKEATDLFVYDEKYQEWGLYDYKEWGIMLRFISENDNINEKIFEKALFLMIEYIRRAPNLYNSFVHHIKTYRFSSNKKYKAYFLLLINNKDDLVSKSLFLESANSFFNSFGITDTIDYRQKIWNTIFYLHQDAKEKIEGIIIEYLKDSKDYDHKVLDFDLGVLLPFIESNYTTADFRMTYWLNEWFVALKQHNNVDRNKYIHLENKFATKEYDFYILLKWNRLNAQSKRSYRKELDVTAYIDAKKNEILQNVIVNNIDDFIPIIKAIKNSYTIHPNYSELDTTIRVILSDILERNFALGIELIKTIIDLFPKIENIVHLPVNLIKTQNDVNLIREYIESLNDNHQLEAKLYFLRAIPYEFLNKEYAREFIDLQEKMSTNIFYGAERFLKFEPRIYDLILSIIISKNRNNNNIKIEDWDIEKYISHIVDINNLILSYFQQKKIDDHFDDSNKIFLYIFSQKEQFLIEYIEFLNKDGKLRDKLFPSSHLASIWNSPRIEEIINYLFLIYKEDVKADIKTILDTKYYRLEEDMFKPLFSDLSEVQYTRALNYLLLKLEEEKYSINITNLILSISRQMGDGTLKTVLHRYLEFDSKLDNFKRLKLLSNSATIVGSGTFGDVYANRWRNILEILEGYPNKFDVTPLIAYVNTLINTYLKQADNEKECEYKGYR